MLEQETLKTRKFDLLDPSVMANPYPLYEQLRKEEPVHWSDDLYGWVLTRYDDVMTALHDPRFSPGGGIAAMFSRLSDDVREEMGANGRKLVEQKFTIGEMVRQFESVYNKAAGRA